MRPKRIKEFFSPHWKWFEKLSRYEKLGANGMPLGYLEFFARLGESYARTCARHCRRQPTSSIWSEHGLWVQTCSCPNRKQLPSHPMGNKSDSLNWSVQTVIRPNGCDGSVTQNRYNCNFFYPKNREEFFSFSHQLKKNGSLRFPTLSPMNCSSKILRQNIYFRIFS